MKKRRATSAKQLRNVESHSEVLDADWFCSNTVFPAKVEGFSQVFPLDACCPGSTANYYTEIVHIIQDIEANGVDPPRNIVQLPACASSPHLLLDLLHGFRYQKRRAQEHLHQQS